MKIYIKGLNACVMRRQKLGQYHDYFTANDHVFVDSPNESDVIVVWTCGFRTDHRDGSIQKIRGYLKEVDAKIVVAGCLPDIAPELLDFDPGRVIVVKWKEDAEKMDSIFQMEKPLRSFWKVFKENRLCKDAAEYRRENPGKDATFHDQFIKLLISEGCNFKCAYCSERLAFPPYRSFLSEHLYESCKALVEKTGVRDVILLADSLGQYGCDIGTNLPNLVRKLKTIHPDIRFAFNNLHLSNFLEFVEEMRFFISDCYIKHLNLPIQSGSDRILRLMNRIYTRKDIETAFGMLKRLGFTAFDTHIIVGFPGEIENDFEQTMELLLSYRPRYVLASKYMESRSAPSAKLGDNVPDKIAFERLQKAENLLSEAGIICNCDGSELSRSRLRRLHQD